MQTPVLSICIPTYNRADDLNEALQSVIGGLPKEWESSLEICISDNASTDDTQNMVKKWQEKSPVPIYYQRNPGNVGGGKNFDLVLHMARGDYVTLMGSDDKYDPKIYSVLKSFFAEQYDLIFINSKSFFSENTDHFLPDQTHLGKIDRVFSDRNEVLKFFSYRIGYITSVFVKRKYYLEHWSDPIVEHLHKRFFSQIYVMMAGLPDRVKAVFYAEHLVLNRALHTVDYDADEFFIVGLGEVFHQLKCAGYSAESVREAKKTFFKGLGIRRIDSGYLCRAFPFYWTFPKFYLYFALLLLPSMCIVQTKKFIRACIRFIKRS